MLVMFRTMAARRIGDQAGCRKSSGSSPGQAALGRRHQRSVPRDVRMNVPSGDGVGADAHALGGMLRAHRERALLSQEALAERAGLTVRTIRQLEACVVPTATLTGPTRNPPLGNSVPSEHDMADRQFVDSRGPAHCSGRAATRRV